MLPGIAGMVSTILVFGLSMNWFEPSVFVTVPIVLLADADVVFAKPEPVIDITSPEAKLWLVWSNT